MTVPQLLASGSEYLRYERGCYLVAWERAPWPRVRPDILGVTAGRKTIEIEIKLTRADFRANPAKRSQRRRARGRPGAGRPHQFFFLVPPALVETVRGELPPGAGLLTLSADRRISGTPRALVIVPAPVDRKARRLDWRELLVMVRHQSGTLCSAAARLARLSPDAPVAWPRREPTPSAAAEAEREAEAAATTTGVG